MKLTTVALLSTFFTHATAAGTGWQVSWYSDQEFEDLLGFINNPD
jgi:hypothetical protein